MLAVGVVKETGVGTAVSNFMGGCTDNLFVVGFLTQTVSAFVDNFATAMPMVSLHDAYLAAAAEGGCTSSLWYIQNGAYWKMIAFAAGVGGNILCTGSVSGLALMKMERIRLSWYFRIVGWKALVGSTIGLAIMYMILY